MLVAHCAGRGQSIRAQQLPSPAPRSRLARRAEADALVVPLEWSSTGHWLLLDFLAQSIGAAGTGVVPLHEMAECRRAIGVAHLRCSPGWPMRHVGRARG